MQEILIQNHRKINLGLGLSPKIIICAAKYQFILNMWIWFILIEYPTLKKLWKDGYYKKRHKNLLERKIKF